MIVGIYAVIAALFGMALGQRGELGVVQHLFAGVIPITTIVLALVSKKGKAAVVLTGVAMLIGLVAGQRQFDTAWNECVSQGSRVRSALVAYENELGGYPARLEQLPIEIPCRAGFRGTILRYLSNERGFRLWFTNDRETWIATDRRPFTASGTASGRPTR